MPEEKKYTSFHAPVRLLKMLDKIMAKRNEEVGAKIWSRNSLIVKAIEDYYFKEIMIPVERRKKEFPVDKDQRKQSDRRRKERVTCAEFAVGLPPDAEGGQEVASGE